MNKEDLISRSNFEKNILNAFENKLNEHDSELLVEFLAHLDDEPTADKWISCEEKLPEELEEVLVWYEYFRYGRYNCMYQTYGIGYHMDGFGVVMWVVIRQDVSHGNHFHLNTRKKVTPMRIPNRHIMYKRYQDGEITETEYKNYLSEQEDRERKTSERFNETVNRLNTKEIWIWNNKLK